MIMKNWSFTYFLLKIYVRTAHWFFYRRIISKNTGNIPDSGPVIFAPNHQNALMDALAVIMTTKRQTVFLARADIFSNPFQAWLLKKLKILPVYRIRDGSDSLQQNDEIFDQCNVILEHGKSIALFPETTHTDKRRLQSLKKGVPRIAFLSEEKNQFLIDIKIIPVGIWYSSYQNYYSTLRLEYGKPIRVAEYKNEFRNNPQKAMTGLKQELTAKLIPLMIDIRNPRIYELFDRLMEIYDYRIITNAGQKYNFENQFSAWQKISQILDHYSENHEQELSGLSEKTLSYMNQIHQLGLNDSQFDQAGNHFPLLPARFGCLVLLFPFFIYGVICSFIPVLFTELIASKIKDTQFRSSVKFGTGLILFPVYFLVLAIIFLSFEHHLLTVMIFLISLPFSTRFFFYYKNLLKSFTTGLRFLILDKKQNDLMNNLMAERKWIISQMDKISSFMMK